MCLSIQYNTIQYNTCLCLAQWSDPHPKNMMISKWHQNSWDPEKREVLFLLMHCTVLIQVHLCLQEHEQHMDKEALLPLMHSTSFVPNTTHGCTALYWQLGPSVPMWTVHYTWIKKPRYPSRTALHWWIGSPVQQYELFTTHESRTPQWGTADWN